MVTARAAILRECPGSLKIEDVDFVDPGPNEVLVRTVASGLCHSDLHWMQGKYVPPLPIILGHEAAGVVEAVGSGVTYLKPGDHVVGCLSVFCGECDYCVTGRPHLCREPSVRVGPADPPRVQTVAGGVQQGGQLGAFAEAMVVHEHALVKIRPDMPLEQAALLGCATITGVGAVINTAKVPAGATVAVIGAGGVGLNVIQGAALAGASRVIAVDLLESKLELATRFGATDVVDASNCDAVETVKDLTGGGVEYAFEAIGLTVTAEQSFAMLTRGGTATVIGLIPAGQNVSLPASDLWMAEKRLQGSSMGSNSFRYDIPRLVDLYLQGRLNLDDLVSKRIGLDEVNDGFAALERGSVARSLIVFE
ncbi:Zn-dependent alcohol dehydrogenase [Pseudonocardia sp. NPDC046786]|uniref:Zn-dependent alcohol dehydrogenase n=1 Tax=Pseudonocardia sp. NPDC046786 TaxID=3155471 RepID=UPI0033E4B01B